MPNTFARLTTVLTAALAALPLVAAAQLSPPWTRAEVNEPARFLPLSDLIGLYQDFTSIQQDAKNKEIAERGKGYWVTDTCAVEDVRESNAFSTLKNVGYEVDCRTNRPIGSLAELYFPQEAQPLMAKIAKGQRIEFRGLAERIDGFSLVKTAYVQVTSVSAPGRAKASAPAIPPLKGSIVDLHKTLLGAGWAPQPVVGIDASGMATALRRDGFPEVEVCAGTGTAPCVLNYTKAGACLRVVTEGEYGLSGKEKYYPGYSSHSRSCPER